MGRLKWRKNQIMKSLKKLAVRRENSILLGMAIILFIVVGVAFVGVYQYLVVLNRDWGVPEASLVGGNLPQLEFEEQEIMVERFLAEHTIFYPGGQYNESRNANLARAAEVINGTTDGYILKPGEKFSWFEVIGNPSEETGYMKAGMIKNGRNVSDWGGGVCQVSSTINSVIQKTDQAIDEKHLYAKKHSKKSAYIDPDKGDKEATVTYPGIDFWFISTMDYPIRLKLESGEGSVTAQIFEMASFKMPKLVVKKGTQKN